MISVEYAAGFFDGEGCVQVGKNGSISVRITNTNLQTLEEFQRKFGGTVLPRRQRANKPQYVWSVYGDAAVEFAKTILPFCIEKHKAISLILDWSLEKQSWGPVRVVGKKGAFSKEGRDNRITELQTKLSNFSKGIYE
jgi:hypothetical protein